MWEGWKVGARERGSERIRQGARERKSEGWAGVGEGRRAEKGREGGREVGRRKSGKEAGGSDQTGPAALRGLNLPPPPSRDLSQALPSAMGRRGWVGLGLGCVTCQLR